MAEPPSKRAKRPDGEQMVDVSDRRNSNPKDPKDTRARGDGRNRDRNRRYRSRSRSRSPRRDHDEAARRERDDHRGSRVGRDHRDREERSDGRNRYGESRKRDGGVRKRRRESKERKGEKRRSRSPRKEGERSRGRERHGDSKRKEASTSKADNILECEAEVPKERITTPPVSFKVAGSSGGTGGQDHDRMDIDGITSERREQQIQSGIKDDDLVVEDDTMAAMQAMMGFGGFGTTHEKKVAGNDIYAVRKEKKTQYRQYMNRVGGFNRPLSPPRER